MLRLWLNSEKRLIIQEYLGHACQFIWLKGNQVSCVKGRDNLHNILVHGHTGRRSLLLPLVSFDRRDLEVSEASIGV